jgi:hypothetical protein
VSVFLLLLFFSFFSFFSSTCRISHLSAPLFSALFSATDSVFLPPP